MKERKNEQKTIPIQKLLICDRVYSEDTAYEKLPVSEYTEISLVESGNGVCKILGQAFPCCEGDIYVISEEVPHEFFASEDGELLTIRRLWISLKDWLPKEKAESGHSQFCFGVFTENETVAYARLSGETLNKVRSFYDVITEEAKRKEHEWQEAVSSNISLLFITISRYIAGAIKNVPSGNAKEWGLANNAIRKISQGFDDASLTLKKVADSLYVSSAQFSRLFKKFLDKTFSEYLREIRLKHACKLLRETAESVEEIVGKCGLRDIPTFYRIFQKQYNLTPNQYRKQYGINTNKKEKKIMQILNDISENLQKGKAKAVKELVQTALDEGLSAKEVLGALLSGMSIIGEKFKNNEVYVPEVLISARAMNMGSQVLKPFLAESGVVATGRACIGTVQGDLHDIGKNLVKMMLEGKGFEVIDLGVDVPPQAFIQAAIDNDCQIICCSALLTTTMGVMEDIVKEAVSAGIRDKVKILIGGAPVTQEYCDKIGADAYSPDAASAADKAAEFCKGA